MFFSKIKKNIDKLFIFYKTKAFAKQNLRVNILSYFSFLIMFYFSNIYIHTLFREKNSGIEQTNLKF